MADEFCSEHSAHARAISKHDERLDTHGEEIDSMRECIVRLTAIQEADHEWRERAEERISALEMKPAARWDSVVDKAVLAVIAGVVGFALSQIGIG